MVQPNLVQPTDQILQLVPKIVVFCSIGSVRCCLDMWRVLNSSWKTRRNSRSNAQRENQLITRYYLLLINTDTYKLSTFKYKFLKHKYSGYSVNLSRIVLCNQIIYSRLRDS
jgi:hypothetical protein